jgi:hypothetical protein
VERTDRGKWSQAGVPHRGWVCLDVIDLGEPEANCEMCESAVIRYVHQMHHDDYPDDLAVGCICAEHMSGDYVLPREREKVLRQRARRRQTWADRQWAVSRKGNSYLKTDGYVLTVFPQGEGWRISVTATGDGAAPVYGKRVYGSQWEAQQGALVALEWARDALPRTPRYGVGVPGY